jgi:hypothetical protein
VRLKYCVIGGVVLAVLFEATVALGSEPSDASATDTESGAAAAPGPMPDPVWADEAPTLDASPVVTKGAPAAPLRGFAQEGPIGPRFLGNPAPCQKKTS